MKSHQNVLIVNVQSLCSRGPTQGGELPFVKTSLNNKLVQNETETKTNQVFKAPTRILLTGY